MRHDPKHTLGENSQQQPPLVLLSLINNTMIEPDDSLQKLIIRALLSHELIKVLQVLYDGLVSFDLNEEGSTSVNSRMMTSRRELKG